VQTRHYRSVGEALVGALAAHLAPDWTPAVERAWRRAYNLVAEIMMDTTVDLEARSTAPPPARGPNRPSTTSTIKQQCPQDWARLPVPGVGDGPAGSPG
jgi:hypothetical protein